MSSKIEDMAIDAIRKVDEERVAKLTIDLANIASPTGFERDVAEFYAERMKEYGMKVVLQEVEPNRFNAVGIHRGKGGGPTLMFNAHFDTSFSPMEPPEVLAAISPVYPLEPPWAYREGNWIYGMGTYNMKCALAAYLEAVRAVQESGVELKGDIMIAGVVGEIEKTQIDRYQGAMYRGYGYGTAYLVTHGGIADMAILGEPTGLRLMTEHFGSVWAKISLRGLLRHTAHSAGVTNVILQMNRIISELEGWLPKYVEKYTYKGVPPTVNIGSLEAGWPWRASRTPMFANLYIDLRYPPFTSPMDVKEDLDGFLAMIRGKYGFDPELEIYVSDAWASIPDDEYIVGAIERAHEAVTGKPVERIVFSWSSDANVLTRFGIAAVNYGPSAAPDDPRKKVRGTIYIPDIATAAKVYTHVVVDALSKDRKEIVKRRYVLPEPPKEA